MRPRTTLSLLCLLLAFAFSAVSAMGSDTAPAHGDAPAAASHEDAGHGDDAHGADKPTLLQWDFGSAFWSVIVFVILLVVLRATAWKPILTGLQQRESFISESLAKAKHERQESEKLLAEYTRKLSEARHEASAIVDEGRRDAEEVRKRVHAEAKTEADAIVARARRDIQMATDDAIKRLQDQSIMLASSMASKIVRKELTAGDHQRLLQESLAELGQANN